MWILSQISKIPAHDKKHVDYSMEHTGTSVVNGNKVLLQSWGMAPAGPQRYSDANRGANQKAE